MSYLINSHWREKIFIHSPSVGNEEETAGTLGLFHPNATMLAGDLIIVHVAVRTSATVPQVPVGWTDMHSDQDSAGNWRMRLFYKVCVGTELPLTPFNVSFAPSLNAVKSGNAYLFRGVGTAFEGATLKNDNNGTLAHNAITITTNGGLALSFYSWLVDQQDAAMTGANRVWKRPYFRQGMLGPVTGLRLYTNMQYAYVGTAVTVSGGSSALGNLSMTRSLAVVP